MIFLFLVPLVICALYGSPIPRIALKRIQRLKFTPQSLRSDFYSLDKFLIFINAYEFSHSTYKYLDSTFYDSADICYSKIKELYYENPTKFIIEVADSDPFLMGLFFFRVERGRCVKYIFDSIHRKPAFKPELKNVSFSFIYNFIMDQFANPITSSNPWEDRLSMARAHISILKRVQEFYYPDDKVYLRIKMVWRDTSMRNIIEKFTFLMEELKLHKGKIDPETFMQLGGKIQSLNKLNGDFDIEQVSHHLDLFKLYVNHWMTTPNDENKLITMHPRMLCLCIIYYNSVVHWFPFGNCPLTTLALIEMAFELIPKKFISLIDSIKPQAVTELSAQDHWQIKVYSRLKYLKRVNKKI
jgi:hypothetical protein